MVEGSWLWTDVVEAVGAACCSEVDVVVWADWQDEGCEGSLFGIVDAVFVQDAVILPDRAFDGDGWQHK